MGRLTSTLADKKLNLPFKYKVAILNLYDSGKQFLQVMIFGGRKNRLADDQHIVQR